MKRLLCLVCALFGTAAAGTFSHGVHGRLSNGMEVVLIHDASLPVVATGILVRAGAENETESISGATHLLEHMLFNGTESMSQESLYTFMELHGLYINAATRKRGTIFIGLAPPPETKALLDVQSEMLFASRLPEEKLEKEKNIVLEELARDRTRPETFVDALHNSLIYAGTPGRFPILGSPATVEQIDRDTLYGYYRRFYIPNNTTLLLMGNFPWPEAWELIQDSFANYPARTEPRLADLRLPPISSIPPETASVPLPNGSLSFTFEGPGPNHPDFPAFYMATDFFPSVVDDLNDSLITSVRLSLLLERNQSRLVIKTELPDSVIPVHASDHLDTLLAHAVRSIEDGDYVDVARTQWTTNLLKWMERPHMFAIMVYDLLSTIGWAGAANLEAAIDTVEADDVARAIDTWLVGQPRAVLTMLPGEGRPSFAALDPKPGAPPKESVTPQGPTPKFDEIVPKMSVVSESGDAEASRARCDTLPSGMVICVRREHGLPLSGLHILLRQRGALEPGGKEGVAELLHRLIARGPSWMDESAFTQTLGRLGAEVKTTDNPFIPFDDYYFSPRWGYVRMTTPTGTFFPATRLVADALRSPPIDSFAVAGVQQEVSGLLFREASSPRIATRQLFWNHLIPGDPRGRSALGLRESVESITAEDVQAFAELYLDASNIVVTVSTTLDAEACLDSLSSIFGFITGSGSPGQGPEAQKLVPGPWVVEDSLGAGQGYIMTGLSLKLTPPEYQSLEVLAAVLGRRMERTLREEKGLAYSLGAFAYAEPNLSLLGAAIGTRPEKLLEAQTDVKRLFAELVAEPVENRLELRASAKRLQQRTVLRRLTREGRAMAMGLRVLHGQSHMTEAKELAGYLSVTPEDLYRLVSRLDRDRICWAIVR